ncbi:hypothetical protein B0H13DRAFT_1872110 [Mycena leptocephala]|nr:hypothetical protein B0H13DRAFT_1872110 [Mycena leptocephala]
MNDRLGWRDKGWGGVGGLQHRGGSGAREVHSEEREVEVRARPHVWCNIKGRVQARVYYVEAVRMRAGAGVTVQRRGAAQGPCEEYESEAARSREQECRQSRRSASSGVSVEDPG